MIDSTAEFHAVIGAAVTAAFMEVMEKIYQQLQKDVQRDIYGKYSPSDYQRTMGLLTSWQKRVGALDAELWFDPSKLPLSPSNWQHGSRYDGGDVRAQILDILEAGYRAYNAHTGKPIPSRPMWQNFIRDVDKNLDRWVRAALRHQGLAVI